MSAPNDRSGAQALRVARACNPLVAETERDTMDRCAEAIAFVRSTVEDMSTERAPDAVELRGLGHLLLAIAGALRFDATRSAAEVGETTVSGGETTSARLAPVLQPTTGIVEEVLEHLRVARSAMDLVSITASIPKVDPDPGSRNLVSLQAYTRIENAIELLDHAEDADQASASARALYEIADDIRASRAIVDLVSIATLEPAVSPSDESIRLVSREVVIDLGKVIEALQELTVAAELPCSR
ncbi:MAG: hypothetical protein GC151_13240 [Betaproteobacteria bacterium]|nr:hypothetical protein [Betaproteobacteria bacterium]